MAPDGPGAQHLRLGGQLAGIERPTGSVACVELVLEPVECLVDGRDLISTAHQVETDAAGLRGAHLVGGDPGEEVLDLAGRVTAHPAGLARERRHISVLHERWAP
jgi:hypothetical protein